MTPPRDWSVYPAWIKGEPSSEYLKVRPRHVAMAIGAIVDVQRDGDARWLPARRVEMHVPDAGGRGSIVWLELLGRPE